MGGLIDALQRLQEIELRINHLRRQEEKEARQVHSAERQIRRIERERAELQAECARHQKELDRLDGDIKSREAAILKHREELLRVRTNKDYSAILTAINTEKADSTKIERLAMEKLAELERVQAELKDRTEESRAMQKRRDAAKEALEAHREKTAGQWAELQEQREAATNALPPTALHTFTRVAERHNGEALAEITRLHPKREEYACGGCNMQIPLDSVNAVRLQNELRLCTSCGRILCLPTSLATGT